MIDNEKDVERRVDRLETRFDMFMEEMREFKAEMREFKAEMRDFKAEMRQQNQMRAEEIRELQKKHETDMRELQKRQDEDRRRHEEDIRAINTKIDGKFDKLSDQLHTMTIAAVVGFGAIAAAVGGLVFAAFR